MVARFKEFIVKATKRPDTELCVFPFAFAVSQIAKENGGAGGNCFNFALPTELQTVPRRSGTRDQDWLDLNQRPKYLIRTFVLEKSNHDLIAVNHLF
jgi:hypothetical protein